MVGAIHMILIDLNMVPFGGDKLRIPREHEGIITSPIGAGAWTDETAGLVFRIP